MHKSTLPFRGGSLSIEKQPTHDEEYRRFRLLIDRLPALIGYWDKDMRNVIANDAYVEFFGMSPGEIRGRHIREVLGEAVYALNLPYIEGALAGREQLFERTLVDARGATRYTQASYIPDIVDDEVQGFYVLVTDVTARVEAEQSRDEALRLFAVSVANAPFGEAVLTTTGRTLLVNPALCRLLGYTAEELTGVDFRDYVHPGDRPTGEEEVESLLNGTATQISSERRYLRSDASTIWMQRNAALAPGREYGAEDVIIAQFQDVTARKLAETELARLAVTDQLTGLNNRHALITHIEEHRTTQPTAPVGIIFIDLDGFKQVNDKHGHAAGDTVLAEVARRLNDAVPEPDSVYRLGGDEFVVFVPEAGQEAVVAELAATVCSVLTGQYTLELDEFHLTASVGWTWGQADDAEELIRRADVDMYRHKTRLRETAVPGGRSI